MRRLLLGSPSGLEVDDDDVGDDNLLLLRPGTPALTGEVAMFAPVAVAVVVAEVSLTWLVASGSCCTPRISRLPLLTVSISTVPM